MPGTNLTREEAAARGALLSADSYQVTLDLTRGPETFASTTVIRFAASEPGATSFADLIAPKVHSVTLNGRELDPETVYKDGRIELAGLAADNELVVVADCAYSNTGQGLHRTVDPVDGNVYVYTHFEVPDCRRVFATFEQPDLKGRFTFTVTAPEGWEVFSNSPTPEPVDGTWHFAPTQPISTYITALVAGPYHVVRDTYTSPAGQVVPLAVACRASGAPYLDADNVLEVTKQGFDYFLEKFDQPYPFEKYDQIFVPEYNIGAMENVGCVTINENYLFRSKVTDVRYQRRAETILHELAHMWFGDLVTMQWWDDLWLKESFATYIAVRCQAEVTKWPNAWTSFAEADKSWALRQDQLPSTHPIVADIRDLADLLTNFDGITYAKGAAVLKQLAAWVGSEAFFAGIRQYFRDHAWGNTTLADLLAALEQASGRDLKSWSADWLQTSGPNTLRPVFTVDAEGRFTSFEVQQEAPADHPTIRQHRIAIGLYERGDAGLVRVKQVELDVAGTATAVPELLGERQPDLVLLNDDDLTYAKIRFDERSLATVLAGTGELTDSLARALCWTAAWDMVRSGELAAGDYIGMALANVGRESEIGVVESIQRGLLAAVQYYSARPRPEVADAALGFLRAAEPGSDLQLSWARTFARLAGTDEQLGTVAAILGGTETIAGLSLDAELRWAYLTPLVKSGKAGEAEVAAQLATDQTTAGQQHAASLLASRPDAGAKAEAWASVIDRDDLSNGMQEAILGGRGGGTGAGFGQTGQAELLASYVDEYFAVLDRIWASRPGEISRNIVAGFYPAWAVEQATIDRTDAYLAEHNPVPALRRILVEQRDEVSRWLRGRSIDA
ncbi:aminopeptidase N [Longispora albida]|uniref:aminopeptidase N n=1 Tax=Longispora albida TaxID=203523 RepID=UPI00036545C9|nr:aminopeptidase N [Longispora albida]